jgi:hypothetical protein
MALCVFEVWGWGMACICEGVRVELVSSVYSAVYSINVSIETNL